MRWKLCPNPLCGGSNIIVSQAGKDHVNCLTCGMTGPRCDSVESAIAAWDSLPRATTLARRELQDQALFEEYQKENTSYEAMGQKYGFSTSKIYTSVNRHRTYLKGKS